MKHAIATVSIGIGVVSGGLGCGALVLMGLGIRDQNPEWFWMMVYAMGLLIIAAVASAIGITLHEPRHKMRRVPHAIAVGRSGAPEITDPMPTPARVRRPVSEAYARQERTLSEGE